jgi:hypothetical protein
MKAIIYAGIGLFSVATVYGVADYYSSQKKGTLQQLYKETDEEEVVSEKTGITKKELSTVDLTTASKVATAVIKKTAGSKKVLKPKRTIRLEEFSRGRIEEPVNIVVPEKTEPKKEEIKVVKEEPIPAAVTIAEEKVEKRRINFSDFSRAPLRTKKIIAKKS